MPLFEVIFLSYILIIGILGILSTYIIDTSFISVNLDLKQLKKRTMAVRIVFEWECTYSELRTFASRVATQRTITHQSRYLW